MPKPGRRREPHHNPDIEATIRAVYGEDGFDQIRTYAEAAEYLGVSKNTVASRLRRANLNALQSVPYDEYLPGNLDPEHQHDRENVMLRTLAEEAAGMHISDKRARELDRFKARSEKLVVVYDPEYGYYWRKREKRDDNYWVVPEE
jgi:hypothetical protein